MSDENSGLLGQYRAPSPYMDAIKRKRAQYELPEEKGALGNAIDSVKEFLSDRVPAPGDDSIDSSFDPMDIIPPEQAAMAGAAGAKALAAKAGLMAPMIGAVRRTATGQLLGTVGEDALAGGIRAVRKDLAQQAENQGIEDLAKPLAKKDFVKPTGASGVELATQQSARQIEQQKMLDSVKARFGDDISDKQWSKLEKIAQASNEPYTPIQVKGKLAGWMPNFKAEPTGVIGDASQFVSGDPEKIFAVDPLKWGSEMKYNATKDLMKKHAEEGLPLRVTTSSDLIAHDDYINALPTKSHVDIVLPVRGEERAIGDPLPSNKRLVSAYQKLKENGISANLLTADPQSQTLKPVDPFTLKRLLSEVAPKAEEP